MEKKDVWNSRIKSAGFSCSPRGDSPSLARSIVHVTVLTFAFPTILCDSCVPLDLGIVVFSVCVILRRNYFFSKYTTDTTELCCVDKQDT